MHMLKSKLRLFENRHVPPIHLIYCPPVWPRNMVSDWEKYDKGKSMIDLFNTLAAIVTLVAGSWIARWKLNIRAATKHLSETCQDEDQMGVFVAQVPSGFRK